MAIKVQWDTDGPFAICDTTEEAMQLLKHARASMNTNGTGNQSTAKSPPKAEAKTMDEKMGSIFAGIKDKPTRLLETLLNYPQGVEGEEFGKVCGTAPAGFGGVLGSISKEAKKVGLTIDQLVTSESRLDGMRRYRWLAPTKLLIEHKHQLR